MVDPNCVKCNDPMQATPEAAAAMYVQGTKTYFAVWVPDDCASLARLVAARSSRGVRRPLIRFRRIPRPAGKLAPLETPQARPHGTRPN
jgi:hypothetical protein